MWILVAGIACGLVMFNATTRQNRGEVSQELHVSLAKGTVLEKQQAPARRWRDSPLSDALKIGGFDQPVLVKPGHAGDVVILDWKEFRITRLADDGSKTLREAIGHRVQLYNPTDITIDEEGAIWIADPPARSLHVMATDGQLISMHTDEGCLRIAMSSDGVVAALTPFSLRGMITLFGTRPLVKHSEVSHILSSPGRSSLALEGYLVAAGRSGFVYATRYGSLLLRIRSDGTRQFLREAILPRGLPVLQVSADDTISVPRSTPDAIKGLAARGGLLYVLVPHTTDRDAIDVYDIENGLYMHSFALPLSIRGMCATSTALYGLSGSIVIKWGLTM